MRKILAVLLCLTLFLPSAVVLAGGQAIDKQPLETSEIAVLQELDRGQMDTIRASGNVPWIVLGVMGTILVYFAYEGAGD